jgi:HAE1 family hydrophobic/amphiphilic exporter-1
LIPLDFEFERRRGCDFSDPQTIGREHHRRYQRRQAAHGADYSVLPQNLKFVVIRDQSEFIENSLHAIEEHLIFGGLLASLVVFLFLWNFRSTIIAAIAIPTSIIAAFAFLAAFGYTLNQMTMLALTLMVGIVIDDAIVVLENIYRFVEEKAFRRFKPRLKARAKSGLPCLRRRFPCSRCFCPSALWAASSDALCLRSG